MNTGCGRREPLRPQRISSSTEEIPLDFGALFGSFDNFLSFTIGGLVFGAIYALIALGYTMVYGVLQLINFAHSEVFMYGTFAVAWVFVFLHGTGSATWDLKQPAPTLPVALVAAMAMS